MYGDGIGLDFSKVPLFTWDGSWSSILISYPAGLWVLENRYLRTQRQRKDAREKKLTWSLSSQQKLPLGSKYFLPLVCSRLQDSSRVKTEQELGREKAPPPPDHDVPIIEERGTVYPPPSFPTTQKASEKERDLR